MTPSDLIDLLKTHPKACAALGITVRQMGPEHRGVIHAENTLDDFDPPRHGSAGCFRRWLLGACVEWCDEHHRDVHQDKDCPDMYIRTTGQFSYETHPTRLHALLAAMEAAIQ